MGSTRGGRALAGRPVRRLLAVALAAVGILMIVSVVRGAFEDLGRPGLPDIVYAGDLPPPEELPDLDTVPDGDSRILLWAASDQPRRVPPADEVFHARIEGLDGATAAAIEGFSYTSGGDGRITIDPAWVDRHTVTTEVPILGRVTCHRLLIPQLEGALRELELRDLAGHLDPEDYAGCFNPRHIGRDPARPLSMHAFGLAFDVNASTNAYGAPPELDSDVVKVFERYGFVWGGRWRTPDGMHFELGRLPAELTDL